MRTAIPPDGRSAGVRLASAGAAASLRAHVRPAVLPGALFLMNFAWAAVVVPFPFYIQLISPHERATTLQWTGWILGVTPLVLVITPPFWTARWGADPARAFAFIATVQGLCFAAQAFARSLMELLAVRAIIGAAGQAIPFAFMIPARRGSGDARREIATMQSGLTLGQVFGPPVGALLAKRLGYEALFVAAGTVLIVTGLLVRYGVEAVPPATIASTAGRVSWRAAWALCLVVLVGYTHVYFLSPVLPEILPLLHVPAPHSLAAGGWIVFASGFALAAGSLASVGSARRLGERVVVAAGLSLASLIVASLALVRDPWTFAALRVGEMLAVGIVFPLAMARAAQAPDRRVIGLASSSLVAATFVGPIIATNVLTAFPAAGLFLVICTLGLVTTATTLPVWPASDDASGVVALRDAGTSKEDA